MLWYAKLKDILHVGDGAVVKLWRFDPAKIMEKGKYDDGKLASRILSIIKRAEAIYTIIYHSEFY